MGKRSASTDASAETSTHESAPRWGAVFRLGSGVAIRNLPLAFVLLLPALIASIVYANTLGNGFAGDDPDTHVRLLDWTGDWRGFVFVPRGITYLFHLFDRWLWPDWPAGFHFTNLVLNSLASTLSAYAAYCLSHSRRVALACGVLFAVHPVHVEAVASFVNRKDLLAMIFAMLLLVGWIRWRNTALRYGGCTVLFLLGFYSKEVAIAGMVVMLPLASFLLSIGATSSEASRPNPLRGWGGLFPLALLALLLYHSYSRFFDRLLEPAAIFERTVHAENYREVLCTALATLPEVFRLLIFPVALSVDYPTLHTGDPFAPRVLLGASLFLIWTLVAFSLRRRAPLAAFAMLWFIVMFLPVSNLLPIHHIFLADRYLYVPSFGLCLLLAFAFDRALESRAMRRRGARTALLAIAVTIVVSASLRSVVRNRDWQDQGTLSAAALDAGFETLRIHRAVGLDLLAARRLKAAEDHFRRAVALEPAAPQLTNLLATSLVLEGRRRNIPRPRLGDAFSLELLGKAFLYQRWSNLAVAYLRLAIEQDPFDRDIQTTLALVLATTQVVELRDAEEAVRLAGIAAQRLHRHRRGLALCVLAAAQAEAGDFRQAALSAARAAALGSEFGDDRLVEFARAVASHANAQTPYRLQATEQFDLVWGWSF